MPRKNARPAEKKRRAKRGAKKDAADKALWNHAFHASYPVSPASESLGMSLAMAAAFGFHDRGRKDE